MHSYEAETFEAYEEDFEDEDDEVSPPCTRCTVQQTGKRSPLAPVALEQATSCRPPAPRSRGGALELATSAPWSLITLKDLQLGEELARGSFSAVHAGSWRGRAVAVKVLTDNSSAQLSACQAELLVHATLSGHAGVVQLYGANLQPPECCIVMERCCSSLFDRLHGQHEDLDRRAAVGMALQVADAMAFLHAQSPPVVHRDLKSHNVLLDDEGRCRRVRSQ